MYVYGVCVFVCSMYGAVYVFKNVELNTSLSEFEILSQSTFLPVLFRQSAKSIFSCRKNTSNPANRLAILSFP